MNLLLLLIFGFLLFFVYDFFINPEMIIACKSLNSKEKKVVFFPIMMLFFVIFLFISAFQYIDTSEAARWNGINNKNDLSRYFFAFEELNSKTYFEAIKSIGQEPLYILYIYVVRKLTNSFSVFLLLTYTFEFYCLYSFLKLFKGIKSFIFYFVAFISIYTLILLSYCLLRMGLAFSCCLFVYKNLFHKKTKKALCWGVVACGFHISAIIIFTIIVIYSYSLKHSLKSTFRFFIFFLILAFILSCFMSIIINNIFSSKVVYLKGSLAKGTYISNFIFLVLLLAKGKKFYENKQSRLMFCIMLCSFYIMPLQLTVSVFYRMIFYIYPAVFYISILVYNLYNSKEKIFSTVCARGFVVFYNLLYLYRFCTESWNSYGLNTYSLFYFY